MNKSGTSKHLTDREPDMQSLEELWQSLSKISLHVVNDNRGCSNLYPVDIRTLQLRSIKALIEAIDHHHLNNNGE